MIDHTNLLIHAQQLYNSNSSDEVTNRNIAHNAYYALFHKLKGIADKLPRIPSEKVDFGSHELVIQKLRSSDNKSFNTWGVTLGTQKVARVKADYKLSCNYSRGEAYKVLRITEKTIIEIDNEISSTGKLQDNTLNSICVAEAQSALLQKTRRPALKVIK